MGAYRGSSVGLGLLFFLAIFLIEASIKGTPTRQVLAATTTFEDGGLGVCSFASSG